MDSVAWFARFGREFTVSVRHIPSLPLATALPLFQDTTFVCSLVWILYRIWQIYQKPVDELVDLLGLDIPPAPEVSLAGITSDSVLLYWKPPELHSSSLKHAIQVNGIKVGEFGRGDASIQVTGLKPGNYYNIRVIATNATSFSTLGPLIRLRTASSQSSQGDGSLCTTDEGDEAENEAASIRAAPSHFEASSITTSHATVKEPPTSQQNNKRTVSGRRSSPATSITNGCSVRPSRTSSLDEDESDEAIQRLTEKLDSLRREQQDLDRQIHEEDEDFRASIVNLTGDRDHLKQTLKEREEASNELRKHGNQLDKLNRSAQSKKAAKEKILNQKRAERQKIKDDIVKWEKEIVEMREDVESLEAEKLSLIDIKKEEVAQIKDAISNDQVLIRTLEEEIRMKGIQIKELEKEREQSSASEGEKHESARAEITREQAWEARAQSMQVQLVSLWQALQRVEADNQHAQERLAFWLSRRSRDPNQFGSVPVTDYIALTRSNNVRKSRHTGSRTSTISSPSSRYAGGALPFNNSLVTASPTFSAVSPFFNVSNGMTLASAAEYNMQAQNEADILAGGGAMSPAANDLLPSNLFREEDPSSRDSTNRADRGSINNADLDLILEQRSSIIDTESMAPQTPVSATSRADSLISSQVENLPNHPSLQNYRPLFDSLGESDKSLFSSTKASPATNSGTSGNLLASSRLAHIFPTLHRQRVKTNAHEPPALGTLKQGQSRSFPRNLEQDDLDLTTTRQRRGSHGSWARPMSGILGLDTPEADSTSNEGNNDIVDDESRKKSRLSMFSSRGSVRGSSALTDNPSSRPSSMYSFDQPHGRPSSDSQRLGGWQASEAIPNRSSPLGTHWSTTGGPWSRGPSRRPSVQHGSTSNLSIGSTPLDVDSYEDAPAPQRSEQLPIGTRPRSSQKSGAPRLNPTAPNFKSFFGLGESKKAAKAEGAAEKAAEQSKEAESENLDEEELYSPGEGLSPSRPRLSKDAGSVTTATSTADSYDSLDHTTSATAADASTPSGSKETFMQKISRKSSSSKFNVPWGKDRGGLFSKRTGEPFTSGEVDEDVSSEGQVDKSADNLVGTPKQEKGSRSSLSWPNMRRKSKKIGPNTEKNSETADEDEL